MCKINIVRGDPGSIKMSIVGGGISPMQQLSGPRGVSSTPPKYAVRTYAEDSYASEGWCFMRINQFVKKINKNRLIVYKVEQHNANKSIIPGFGEPKKKHDGGVETGGIPWPPPCNREMVAT